MSEKGSPVLSFLLAGLILGIALLAAVPPVDRDALTHHLAVPKLYLQHGGIVELPEIEFSYYPMNLDLLYLIALFLGNDILPKYIHFAFGLLTAFLIYLHLFRRLRSRFWGLAGAVFFLSLPVVVKLSITVYVDLGLIFFSTAALLSLLQWAESGMGWRWMLVSAISCGLALGTKYNGLITFFLLSALVPFLAARSAKQASPRILLRTACWTAAFIAISLTVFSPWMIRNVLWTGNPIYPLYNGVFRSWNPVGETRIEEPAIPAGEEGSSQGMGHFVARRLVFGESALETFSIPLRIFFQGEDDNPKYFDGRLNPALFLFSLIAFWAWGRLGPRERTERIVLAGFSLFYLLYTFFTVDMRIRYVGPIVPPLVILSVYGMKEALHLPGRLGMGRKTGRQAAIPLVLLALVFAPNGAYIARQFEIVRPLDYLTGLVSRDDYIARHRKDYPAFRFINAALPEDAKILGLYMGNRLYYSDRLLVFGDRFFEESLSGAQSAADLAARILEKGFSHILLWGDLLSHLAAGTMSAKDLAVFNEFIGGYTRTLFARDGFFVLEIVTPAADSSPYTVGVAEELGASAGCGLSRFAGKRT
ncbi:MAG: phospholipid carrier-dependent glycosyltransferase [Desulfobacterales bacterium]